MQEITPPPGYKLDSTIHTYTVTGDKTTTAVYDLTPTDISDEVYKGRISLEKLAEMLNAADVPETGAVFEVYLKSAGSFAAAKTTERDMAVTEQVKRGGIAIEKRDLESGLLTPLGGASLDGTAFEITNLSKNPVKVGEGEFVPGEVVLTLVIENGKAQSEPDALPYH